MSKHMTRYKIVHRCIYLCLALAVLLNIFLAFITPKIDGPAGTWDSSRGASLRVFLVIVTLTRGFWTLPDFGARF